MSSLQEDVRDRNYQLRALQSEVGTIRDQIQERYIGIRVLYLYTNFKRVGA